MGLSALSGGLGAVGDFISGDSAAKRGNKYEEQLLARLMGYIDQEGGNQALQYGKAEAALRGQLPVIRKAAKDAQANLALTADRRARQLQQNEQASLAQGAGSVYRAGMSNSNANNLVSRGVRSDTTRAMQNLDELFQQSFNQIGQQEVGQLGGVAGGIAQNKQAFADSALELMRKKLEAESGRENFIRPNQLGAGLTAESGLVGGGGGGGKGKGKGGGIGGGGK
jgi:hypothetical protein